MQSTDWRNHIHSDPTVLSGKPVLRNTRLGVDFILELLAAGWSEAQLLDNYPGLSAEGLRAVYAFAAECLREEALHVPTADQGLFSTDRRT